MPRSHIPHHGMPFSSWLGRGSNRSRKAELKYGKEVPTISEITENLTAPLAEIFFENLPNSSKEMIGLVPSMVGYGSELWQSPSDALIGKLCLVPPFTIRHKEALKHQSILELGEELVMREEMRHQRILKSALKEQERELLEKARIELEQAVLRAKIAEQKKYEAKMSVNLDNLDMIFKEVLAETEKRLLEEANLRLEEAMFKQKTEMELELQKHLCEREVFLCNQFDFKLEWECNKKRDEYEQKLKKHKDRWLELFQEARDMAGQDMEKQRLHLETLKSADLLETVCQERRRCQALQKENEAKLEAEMLEKLAELNRSQKEIEMLRMRNEKSKKRIMYVESKIGNLIKQFQKFITFALKEKPGQAEFLLSVRLFLTQRLKDITGKQTAPPLKEGLKTATKRVEAISVAQTMIDELIDEVMTYEPYSFLYPEHQIKKETQSSKQQRSSITTPINVNKLSGLTIVEKSEIQQLASKTLRFIGESVSRYSLPEVEFKMTRAISLLNIFDNHPSLLYLFYPSEFVTKFHKT